MRNMNHTKGITAATLGTMVLVAALAPTIDAEGLIPEAAPDFATSLGYDWASRLHATHMMVDATPLYVILQAEAVVTPYIDLEITGLMPWRTYELRLGTITRSVHTDGAGHGVAWNVIGETSEWVLFDGISREPVTTIAIRGPPPTLPDLDATIEEASMLKTRYRVPTPEDEALEDGWVVEQGLYSFTPAISITGTTSIQRLVNVEAYISGGIAGWEHTGGGSLSYEIWEERVITAAGGEQKLLLRQSNFKKDTYEDGSYKIYAIGTRSYAWLKNVDQYFNYAGWVYRFRLDEQTVPQTILTLKEVNAGTVRYEGATHVFGSPIKAKFKATVGESNTNKMSFVAQPGYTGEFVLDWIVGDNHENPQTGMVGIAWQES